MTPKNKCFADDAWAFWVDGDDTSTVYINDWIHPEGKSYIDIAVRIRGILSSNALHIYVPFPVTMEEMEDVSLMLEDTELLRATFSAACIIDFMKNNCTSEVAYNGRTIDLVHPSLYGFELVPLAEGVMLNMDLKGLRQYLDNDEAYLLWRLPHKTLDELFENQRNTRYSIRKFRELLTSPVVSEKYGYSVRINESRLLPLEINKIGAFHRQKLKKAVVTISVDDHYELNDAGCYRIRRLEKSLYQYYLPKDYSTGDTITYQWNQKRDTNERGHYNFFFNIAHQSVSRGSLLVYMALLLIFGAGGNALFTLIYSIFT